LQRINNEIAGTDVEQIKEWEHKLKEYRSSKERYIEEIAEDKIRIKAINDKIAGLGKDLEKELKKEKKHEELRKILVFCDESLRAANGIKNGIMDMLRKEIEEKTKIQFFNLIWKKRHIKMSRSMKIMTSQYFMNLEKKDSVLSPQESGKYLLFHLWPLLIAYLDLMSQSL